MTKDEAIELARAAGATPYTNRHYPDRPTHTFNVEQLEAFATNAYKQGRNAVVDEAKRAIQESSSPFTTAEVHIKRLAIASIESLKDNTP